MISDDIIGVWGKREISGWRRHLDVRRCFVHGRSALGSGYVMSLYDIISKLVDQEGIGLCADFFLPPFTLPPLLPTQ